MIKNMNLILSQAFHSMRTYVEKLENQTNCWELNAIYGHNKAQWINELTFAEAKILFEKNIITLSQLIHRDEITNAVTQPISISMRIENALNNFPLLCFKLKNLLKLTAQKKVVTQGTTDTNIAILIKKNGNISRQFQKISKAEWIQSIKIAPAYNTRIRDGVDLVSKDIFIQAFQVVNHKYLTTENKRKFLSSFKQDSMDK